MEKKNFYRVEVRSRKYSSVIERIDVLARSISQAETKALKIVRAQEKKEDRVGGEKTARYLYVYAITDCGAIYL